MKKKNTPFRSLLLILTLAFTLGGLPAVSEAVVCPDVIMPVYAVAGYEQLTISTLVISLTVPRLARMAVITVETEPIRYRDDGTAVTASVGTLIKADGSIVVCGKAMDTIGFIRDGGSDATLNVNYYGG